MEMRMKAKKFSSSPISPTTEPNHCTTPSSNRLVQMELLFKAKKVNPSKIYICTLIIGKLTRTRERHGQRARIREPESESDSERVE